MKWQRDWAHGECGVRAGAGVFGESINGDGGARPQRKQRWFLSIKTHKAVSIEGTLSQAFIKNVSVPVDIRGINLKAINIGQIEVNT